jgi:hypothetical protein
MNNSFCYTLYSSLGAIFVREYKIEGNQTNWWRLKGLMGLATEAPPYRERREWVDLNCKSLDEAIQEFNRRGSIQKAQDYQASLVEGLEDGWNSELIKGKYSLEKNDFSYNDFIPYQALPANRKSFYLALLARKALIEELEEIEEDYPLAGGDWQELVGDDTLSDIRREVSDYEAEADEQVIQKLREFGKDIDYDGWSERYLGQGDYENAHHYRHCKRLFTAGCEAFYRALAQTRADILEGLLLKEQVAAE